jgi:hypothetical protein
MPDLVYRWMDGNSNGRNMYELERNHVIDFHLVFDFICDAFGPKSTSIRPFKRKIEHVGCFIIITYIRQEKTGPLIEVTKASVSMNIFKTGKNLIS